MVKGKIIKLLLALLFIIGGILLFIYPRITDKIYKDDITQKKITFNEVIEDSVNPKLQELYDVLSNENLEIYNNHQYSFLYDKTYDIPNVNLSDYGLTDNIFGFIEIPSINVTLPIYFGSSDENMRLGATHLTGTSYPIGGVNTNSVIAAHRGYYKTEMFRHIDQINIGDTLIITNPYGKMTYVAFKTAIIKPDELDDLTIVDGEDMVTLISCHPFPSNYQRYVVYFKRG